MNQNLIQNVKVTQRKQLLQPRTASCWYDEDMTPLECLHHDMQSDSICDCVKSIQNMIGAMNISNDITEEDINGWPIFSFHWIFPKK